ncbi:MAG: ribosome biogenesis GTPase Der [Fidelibacterota bacterium]|nr:MAG: ribosome biogenesis GTPase Der [Candidatus Neomarinimicrobiota bacterium]
MAILGRPNVGKSTLFNRLVGRRQAIVDETAGVTRDRIYGTIQWAGHGFHLIDTGGYLAGSGDILEATIRRQAELAGEEANLILFMVDSQAGIVPDDRYLADQLRKLDKPVLLVVNKVDDVAHETRIAEFYELGLGEPLLIGAIAGRGVGDLLDAAVGKLSGSWREEEILTETVGLAIVGVPNTGKSSFLNAILKEDKAIVTPIPGTTRDSIDSFIRYMGHTLRLIDTAGLRRKARISNVIEYYSTVRTLRSIDECHVAIVIIDAERGFHTQDRQIMSRVMDQGKGLVAVVNKWDVIKKDTETMGDWTTSMRASYKPLEYVPLVFISVHHNQRVWKTLKVALEVYEQSTRQISTSELNRFLEEAVGYQPPPAVQGKRIQIKYAAQVHRQPPLFAFFCNYPRLIPVSYRRYLENRLRERFGFDGVPVKLSFRQK